LEFHFFSFSWGYEILWYRKLAKMLAQLYNTGFFTVLKPAITPKLELSMVIKNLWYHQPQLLGIRWCFLLYIHNLLYSRVIKILLTYLSCLDWRTKGIFQIIFKELSLETQFVAWRYFNKFNAPVCIRIRGRVLISD